jgi:hypothetical protein
MSASHIYHPSRAGLRVRPTGQLPAVPTYEGRQEVTRVIRNMVLVHSGFYTRKNFSENFPQFGHARSQNFASTVNELKKV